MWQPIETAPKSAPEILAYVPRSRRVRIVRWTIPVNRKIAPCWRFGGEPCEPSHWMPVPEPPKCEACGGRGYVVYDSEWEPYTVQCPKCAPLSEVAHGRTGDWVKGKRVE